MKFREFHSFLTKWNIPLDTYIITEELLETELWIHESRNAVGDLLAMSVTIAGDPPKGSWFIRFDGAHGIVWDGQIVPVYSEDGSSNPMFEALLQSTADLRISLALEKAEKDIGGDIETLKRFQQHVAEEITEKEALLLLESSDDTSDSTVEDGTEEGTTEDGGEETTEDGTAEGETGSEASDGSSVSAESGSEETSTDPDGSTLEGSQTGDSSSDGLADDGSTSASSDDGSDTESTDGSTTDDSSASTGGETTDSSSSESSGDSTSSDGTDSADTSTGSGDSDGSSTVGG